MTVRPTAPRHQKIGRDAVECLTVTSPAVIQPQYIMPRRQESFRPDLRRCGVFGHEHADPSTGPLCCSRPSKTVSEMRAGISIAVMVTPRRSRRTTAETDTNGTMLFCRLGNNTPDWPRPPGNVKEPATIARKVGEPPGFNSTKDLNVRWVQKLPARSSSRAEAKQHYREK